MVAFSKHPGPDLPLLLAPPGAVATGGLAQQAPGESFLGYLFVAFAIVWLLFFGYLFYLARRQADLRRDMEQLYRSTLSAGQAQRQGTSTRRE
ncbi:MAG: CcmD family protein [Dehalococcoidia bacterium]